MYHIANGIAIFEFLITLYFKSELKSLPYVSTIGDALLSIDVLLQLTQSFFQG
jgi:protein-S-isoprenylcysteine O-methyltransferase